MRFKMEKFTGLTKTAIWGLAVAGLTRDTKEKISGLVKPAMW